MAITASLPPESFWQKDSFRFIKAEDFESLGIDSTDIPLGTFAAFKHPTHLPSKFGGNAYGFGLFEVYDRLKPKDIKLIQSIVLDNPESIGKHYKALNEIYTQIGLLIRFSKFGKQYYLIPVHLASDTLTHIKSKVDEITKIVDFHSRKFLKEYHDIALLTDPDDLITRELSFRFKDHNFVAIDSLEKLQTPDQTMDLVILTRDLSEIIMMETFGMVSQGMLTKKKMKQYSVYLLWKIYNILKPDGEIFVISNTYTSKTHQTAEIKFKIPKEEKKFLLFSHIFKTKKKYQPDNSPMRVNTYDFQKYLSGLYVEQEVVSNLLKGKSLDEISLDEISNLPYLNLELSDFSLLCEQEKTWSKVLSIYFDDIFLKPLVPPSVMEDWDRRFSSEDYSPKYMMIYLGQKKILKTTLDDLMKDVAESRLLGCPVNLLAEYRNRFVYVIQTLRILEKLKNGIYGNLPETFADRLRQPLINKNRRFNRLNDVLKLISKIKKLESVEENLNPENKKGVKTPVLENIEALSFFGFSYSELREIIFIVYGHSSMGRIISGKTSVKAFNRILELIHSMDTQQAINFLRYCRLMTMAETEAASGSEFTQEQISELFNFYDSAARAVSNRDLDWDEIVDERIGTMGGIHNKVIRKILKMMNYYEYINNWAELEQMGRMEKESLADYDEPKLERIENAIRLVRTIDRFEKNFQKTHHQELFSFYRTILEKEYHGTGYLFERMDSRIVFTLIAINSNLSGMDIINLNPLLADLKAIELDKRVKKIEQEAQSISIGDMDFDVLNNFSEQLHKHRSSFFPGTGFKIKIDPESKTQEMAYLDVEQTIEQLEVLYAKIEGCPIPQISLKDMKSLEIVFSELEDLYQSHQRFMEETNLDFASFEIQKQWVQKIEALRKDIRSNFLALFFRPQNIYTNLARLYSFAPSVLDFILPEFTALHNREVSWHLYMTSPVTHYIIAATRKLQALITRDRKDFQDIHFLHKLAQREFGPMATGTVGVSSSQIAELEKILENLSKNKPVFEAFIKSFIFQDFGRLPALREKYKDDINPAELAQASAIFIEKEDIAKTYNLDDLQKQYLIFLVRYHSLFHHVLRGEFSFSAIKAVTVTEDRDLFDAFFVFSFIMLSSIRDDLILEDLADQLFKTKSVVDSILDKKTNYEEKLNSIYIKRGNLFFALEFYKKHGLPKGMAPASYLDSQEWGEVDRSKSIWAGKNVSSLERVFRLCGIRHIKYIDLVNLMIKVPLKFIYKQRKLSSIGYATFEKELFEAFRIYNTIRILPEKARLYTLELLVDDKVRIFGYEKVSGYLSYKNQIKLLLISLLGSMKIRQNESPMCLNFLILCEKIEKRYEAINNYLNTLSADALLEEDHALNHLFTDKTGLILIKENFPNVCTIDFEEDLNLSQKISHMIGTNDLDQLKSYFHSSLRSLRQHPFATDDYEEKLAAAFEKRQAEIVEMILNQAKRQMDLIHDFKELQNLVHDLLERSLEIGFSVDQKHKLNDLYEMRKENLKKEKLSEIERVLNNISHIRELQDHWDSIKYYLQTNRRFFGREFENIISKKYDAAEKKIESQNPS